MGRVIVIIDTHEQDPITGEAAPTCEVYAVPGRWDSDDIDRFIQESGDAWVSAVVAEVQEVPNP